MKRHIAGSALALAVGLGIVACATDTPTAPQATVQKVDQSGQSHLKSRGQSLSFPVSGPLTRAEQVVGNFAGTFNVTKFGFDEATHQLTVTGVLSGTETFTDGTTATVADKVVTTTATLKKGSQVSSTGSGYQFAAASCGILLLDLGPLHLDLLGLVVDLNEVILDITAQTGANNLLGNLLCALTGLLDIPGAIAGILNLINSINTLLGNLGLASPVLGPSSLGGMSILPGAVAILRSA
jgi:flagellin-like hook-associated protein FlgL